MSGAIRISASDIDALHYYLNDEDGDLAGLLARLRRESPPTDAMLAGTALHTALENGTEGDFSELSADGYTFELRINDELDLPAVREIKSTRDYEIDGVTVTLVGKVDAILGKRVDDHKLTSRFDAERFLNSMQWRAYLEVFDANEFRWNVFEGRPESADPKRYVINGFHPLRMHRYPGMGEDLERAIARFVEFARVHLPERFTAKSEAA
jgi:hypothetical protein